MIPRPASPIHHRLDLRATPCALGIVTVLLGCFAAPTWAGEPRSGTAPAYPGNTIKVERKTPIVAGTSVKVRLSGHADWGGPTDSTTTRYSLYLFVQNAAVEPNCAPSYDQQLQSSINLPLRASNGLGFVVDGNQIVNPAPPAPSINWSIKSLPFSVRPGVKRVLLCAYKQYITDDVAYYQLPVKVSQPSCTPGRRAVRRGRRLGLKCNVSGPIRLKLKRKGARRAKLVKSRASTKDGRARLSTKGLRRGSYRATAYTGKLRLGKSFRVRIG